MLWQNLEFAAHTLMQHGPRMHQLFLVQLVLLPVSDMCAKSLYMGKL